MPWLDHLDARAKQWPAALRWPYRSLKWFLILMGIYLVSALAVLELREGRMGLGLGVAVAALLATVKGLFFAFRRRY